MSEIEYVDDEQSETVAQIQDLLEEGEDDVVAVVVCSPDGLNVFTNANATPEELEGAKRNLAGLLEHFDRLIDAARENSGQ